MVRNSSLAQDLENKIEKKEELLWGSWRIYYPTYILLFYQNLCFNHLIMTLLLWPSSRGKFDTHIVVVEQNEIIILRMFDFCAKLSMLCSKILYLFFFSLKNWLAKAIVSFYVYSIMDFYGSII